MHAHTRAHTHMHLKYRENFLNLAARKNLKLLMQLGWWWIKQKPSVPSLAGPRVPVLGRGDSACVCLVAGDSTSWEGEPQLFHGLCGLW